MWAVISTLHDAGMRSRFLPVPVLVASLGCVILSGCGTHNATAGQTPAGHVVPAASSPAALPGDNDPELRFLAVMHRITLLCATEAPDGKGSDSAPEPEDLPGWEAAPTPEYGPGQTPPGVANAEGDIPIPVDDPAPSEPAPDSSARKPVTEVPLTGIEQCDGAEHAQRVSEALKNTKTTSYQAMHKKLTGLDYPASRIHRMPDRAGAPRARLDLRMMGSHLVLEVTGTGDSPTVEAFGAPETEDTNVTDVQRKPKPDAPTS
jgi:hypothetical protein